MIDDQPKKPDGERSDAFVLSPPPKMAAKARLSTFSRFWWWPLIVGAIAGVGLRLIFISEPGGAFSAMSSAFLYFAPFAVGAVTVFFMERRGRCSWGQYALAGAAANALFVIGTMLIMVEGLICAIIIVPLFAAIGALAGLIMGAVCRLTNWPKPGAYGAVALPVLMAFLMPSGAGPISVHQIERTIEIATTPERVWAHLLDAPDIKHDEVQRAWMYRIGVPEPIAGTTMQTNDGRLVRTIEMGKSIHFQQIATDWKKNEFVRWNYVFAADSIPPMALDDHVMIGGHYFDLLGTDYELKPLPSGNTALTIRMKYRVSTQFNWYANYVAKLLIANFEEVILEFYQRMAENTRL